MSWNLPVNHHHQREEMCVHVQVMERRLARHRRTFSPPCHGSHTAVRKLLFCSFLSVYEELEVKSQSNLPKHSQPEPAAIRGDARLASSQTKHLLQWRGNVDAGRAHRRGRCWKQLFPGVAPCLPFSNPGAVGLQLKLTLTVATELVLAARISTGTAVCEATR